MSDGSRGISLRKKKTNNRPKISAPRPVAEELSLSQTTSRETGGYDGASLARSETQSSLRSRPAAQGAAADLVKRRYSTRYVGYPLDAGMPPPMPSMPSIPAQYQDQVNQLTKPPSRDREEPKLQKVGSRNLQLDLRALRDPSLVPEQCKCSVSKSVDRF